jgi:hypothetical protein
VKIINKIKLEELDKKVAIDFIRQYHYSKILPRLTKYYIGVYLDNELSGVVTLGWGTQPLKTIQKIFPDYDLKTKDYYEIGKMCFLPKYNNTKNFGSQVISALIKWVKQNTDCLFLYTLADGIMGKCGYVYQASNFKYIGNFLTSVYIDNNTGEKIHPRSSKLLLRENENYENKDKLFWLTYNFCEYKNISKIYGLMFRYIYPLNKKANGILNSIDKYKNLINPKDKDLRFYKRIADSKRIEIDRPEFNMNIFNYNYQKPNVENSD